MITLTLTALVGTMIVSFCILINDRVQKNSRLTAQMEELTSVRAFIERWVAEFDRADVSFAIDSSIPGNLGDGVFLYARAGTQGEDPGFGYLQLSGKKIRAFRFKEEDTSAPAVEAATVDAVLVTEITVGLFSGTPNVYQFAVKYEGGIERFTFLVNRRTPVS